MTAAQPSNRELWSGLITTGWLFCAFALLGYTLALMQPLPEGSFESFNGMSGTALFWYRLGSMALALPVVTAALTLLLAPLGWCICQLLRFTRSVAVHILGFACLGAAIGTAATFVCPFLMRTELHMGLVVTLSLAAALPLGYWSTIKPARL